MTKTATDFRNEAAAAEREAHESFERCDTDGFVSQFCNGLTARLKRHLANIVEDGNTSVFTGLFEGDRRVKAREITTKFGTAWLLHEDEVELIEARGKKFLPTGANSRILKNLGLAERAERAPAWAKLDGNGTGFSGLSSVYIKTFRTGDKWGMDAELVEEDEA